MNSRRGRLYVISAPSGAGKTTLVHRLMAVHPGMRFSISYTTRRKRRGEVEGQDYFFVTKARFDEMIKAQEFLEYAQVFGNWYGTGRGQVEALLDAGFDVLLEIDWQGAQQVRINMPDCCSIFVLPPSVAELERRLRGRSTDPEEVIQRRLGEALGDISHWQEFDHVILNDDLDQSVAALRALAAGQTATTDSQDPEVRRRVQAVLADS